MPGTPGALPHAENWRLSVSRRRPTSLWPSPPPIAMQRGEFSIRPGSNTSEGHEASENRLLPQRAKVGYCPCCAPATQVAANVNYALGAHDVLKEKGSCPVDPSSIGHVAILRDSHTPWSWMGQGCAKPPHGQAAGAAPKMGITLKRVVVPTYTARPARRTFFVSSRRFNPLRDPHAPNVALKSTETHRHFFSVARLNASLSLLFAGS